MEIIILIVMIYIFYQLWTNESLLIGFWVVCVLIGIIGFIGHLISSKKSKSSYTPQISTENNNKNTSKVNSKKVKYHFSKNKLLTDSYNNIINRKKELEKNMENIESQINDINNFVGKPKFMSKKKYTKSKAGELKSLENKLSDCKEKLLENKCIKLNDNRANFDDTRRILKLLNVNILGYTNIENDLKYIDYNFKPIFFEYNGYGIYLFSNSVWIFEDNEFVGAYNPFAVQVSYYEKEAVTEQVPHHTWEHTCKDGSPDLRYKNNRMITYYTTRLISKAEYKVKLDICNLICERTFDTKPENIKDYVNAVEKYSQSKGFRIFKPIPALLELLEMCGSKEDSNLINNEIKNYIKKEG